MTSQNPAPDGLLDRDAIDMLVVHCSDTPDDQALGARDIQEMHLGFGWDGIGYHHVICRDGTREAGRPEYWRGAHARGANERSLSVCLIGRSSFTAEQMDSLGTLLDEWRTRYPNARILGHRDAVETDKTCPNFDVESWWRMRSLAHPADRLSVTAPAMALTASPDTHALETELLFGESVQVLERTNGFARVILETDGYEGWVSARGTLAETRPATHRLCCAAIHVLAAPDVKSSSLMRLSMGARLAVEATDDGWHQISFPAAISAGFQKRRHVLSTASRMMSSALRNVSLDVPIYGAEGARRALTVRRWCNCRCKQPGSTARVILATSMTGQGLEGEPRSLTAAKPVAAIWCSGPAMSASAARRQLSFMPMRTTMRWRTRRQPMPFFAPTPPRKPKPLSSGSRPRPSAGTDGPAAPTAGPVTVSPSSL